MTEIKNLTNGPIQLVIKSLAPDRPHSQALTTLNIPGFGVKFVRDERIIKDYISRQEKYGLIKSRFISDNEINKYQGVI
jgi:hypothetical protein